MDIRDFWKKFQEDKDFADSFKKYTDFDSLLKAVNDAGYSISKDDVVKFLEKEKGGTINDEDLKKIVGGDTGPVNFSTACSDACSYGCHK